MNIRLLTNKLNKVMFPLPGIFKGVHTPGMLPCTMPKCDYPPFPLPHWPVFILFWARGRLCHHDATLCVENHSTKHNGVSDSFYIMVYLELFWVWCHTARSHAVQIFQLCNSESCCTQEIFTGAAEI